MAELQPIGFQLVIVTFVFGLVALSTLSVRLWFRLRQRKQDVSDLCLVAAMVCAALQSAIQLILVFDFDYGKAKSDILPPKLTSEWPSKLLYVNQILFKLTTPLSKLSLCLLYRAMCSTSTDSVIKVTRAAIWGTIALIVGAYGSAFFISIFQCTPISRTWDKKVDGTCIDLTQFRMRVSYTRNLYAPSFFTDPNHTAVFNLITSALVITLPIPTLIKFKRRRPEITQLIGLILLGLIHTGLTIVRFVIMFYPDPLAKSEPRYAHIMPNCLAVVEMDIGIWVATLVVMRPAFQAFYHLFYPSLVAPKSTTQYYGEVASKSGNTASRMRTITGKSRKEEDEFHILETIEIDVMSEPQSRRG